MIICYITKGGFVGFKQTSGNKKEAYFIFMLCYFMHFFPQK